MIKALAPKICTFDREWVLCPITARRLLGMSASANERAVKKAVWTHFCSADETPEGWTFLKLLLSQILSRAMDMRTVDDAGAVHIQQLSTAPTSCSPDQLTAKCRLRQSSQSGT